uniref:Uncharacterized protein n=1 Tax=Lepeophtheirus salmonis TaxID=72036 RepID=A0A0K2UZQ8_LEPSM
MIHRCCNELYIFNMIKPVGFVQCISSSLFTSTLNWSKWDRKFGLSTKHKEMYTNGCINRSWVSLGPPSWYNRKINSQESLDHNEKS